MSDRTLSTAVSGDRPSLGGISAGTRIDQFQVVRPIGRGGMGEVFLARDTHLGRLVALKLLLSGRKVPEGPDALVAEARAVAALNHPNIVTLYSVGSFGDRAYLALEFVEGESLRDRLRGERLAPARALRVALAVARALEAAHGAGLLHCDLKPENILLGRDGRPRVVDFGLARFIDRTPQVTGGPRRRPAGTPAYMSPERMGGAEATEATDVWAFGVVLHELLFGGRPFAEETEGQLPTTPARGAPSSRREPGDGRPDSARALLADCLSTEPGERPAAAEIVRRLGAAVAPDRVAHQADVCPFPGLEPFDGSGACRFVGRDAEIAAFLERMRDEPLLSVVGPSGAGKSSFVLGGVVPRLREEGTWRVMNIRPGAHPFRNLAARLAEDTGDDGERTLQEDDVFEALVSPEALARDLVDNPGLLNVLLHELAERGAGRVLLVVDQLEEVFASELSDRARGRFLATLCAAAVDRDSPVRVVLTVRDDYLGRLARWAETRAALTRVTVLRSLDRDALREALVLPLCDVGYGFDDPGLPDEIVSGLADEPGCLPLLQATAHALWDRRDRATRTLTRAAFEELGGVAGALAAHAGRALEGLGPAATGWARTLLLRLVSGELTRKVTPRGALLDGLPDEAEAVLARLVSARLVAIRGGDGKNQGAEFELAHESLIVRWGRLARWVRESRAELRQLAELEDAAALWERRGQRRDEVWRGPALEEAIALASRSSPAPTAEVRRFLDAGRRQERRRRRERRVLQGVGAAIVLTVLVILYVMKGHAEREWAIAQREGATAALARGDLLEARAKLRTAFDTVDDAPSRLLWWELARRPLDWRADLGAGLYDVAFSHDGETVAVASQGGVVHLLDAATREERVIRGFDDQVQSVAFSPDGRWLAAAARSGEVRLVSLATLDATTLPASPTALRAVAISPEGRRLATAGYDGAVRLWDAPAEGGAPREIAGHEDGVAAVAFSADGGTVFSAGFDGRLAAWDAATSAPRWSRAADGREYRGLAVGGPDGRWVVTADTGGALRAWDAVDGHPVGEILVAGTSATDVAVSAALPDAAVDGEGWLLLSAHDDQRVRVWRVRAGDAGEGNAMLSFDEVATLTGHTGGLRSVAIAPDGAHVASAGWDRSVRVWNLARAGALSPAGGHRGAATFAVFCPGAEQIASAGYHDRKIRLWDAVSGSVVRVLPGHDAAVQGLACSPDGRWLASASYDRTARVWDLATGTEVRVLEGHGERLLMVAFSPEGRRLATAGYDPVVRVWSLDGAGPPLRLEGHDATVYDVAFAPDGATLATASADRSVRLWELATGRETARYQDLDDVVMTVAFDAEGRHLAMGDVQGRIGVRDLATGDHRVLGRQDGRVYLSAFHPSDPILLAPDSSGAVTRWDIAGGTNRRLRAHGGEVNSVRFSPDGTHWVSAGEDGTVRLWATQGDIPQWSAAGLVHHPPALVGRRGVRYLTAAAADGGRLDGLEPGIVRSHARAEGDTLCSWSSDLGLVARDLTDGRELWRRATPCPDALRATDAGCATMTDGVVAFWRGDDAPRIVHRGARGLGYSTHEIVVIGDDEASGYSSLGDERWRAPIPAGVSTLTSLGPTLAVGFRDGSLEMRSRVGGEPSTSVALESTPASRVARILRILPGTLAVGFGDGTAGIWSARTGRLLTRVHLHGAVEFAAMVDGVLHLATELGDYRALDLRVMTDDYAAVRAAIRAAVPVRWKDGRAVRSPD